MKSDSVTVKEKRKWCREKYGKRWYDVPKEEKSRRLREARDALANSNIGDGSSASSSNIVNDNTSTKRKKEGSGFDIPGLFD